MATRRTTRTTTTRSSKSGGMGVARFLLPAAALGIGAYLLWPKKANAAVLPPSPGPIPPSPNPLPPPPVPGTTPVEAVADAPLGEGLSRGRITGSNVLVRNGFADNSPILSSLPLGAGVAVMIGPPAPPTANAPQGRLQVRTAGGKQGYVAAQYVRIEQPGVASAAMAAQGSGAPGTAGWAPAFYNYFHAG